MNLQLDERYLKWKTWITPTIILLCAAPAITLNVWPRIAAMIDSGMTSNQLGIVLLVTMSALGMTSVPFAMKKAENYGFWSICLIFGIGLGILNYTMAVGAIGKARDYESDSKKAILEKATTIRNSISENERAKSNLPPFKWTSEEMVRTATKAVDLAREARDQECTKVGDICRARVTQLGSRQSELADIGAQRAYTQRAEDYEQRIGRARLELSNLGPIPDSSDQQASRIAAAISFMLPIRGPNAESVATGLIHFIALCAEAFALGMPRILITAIGRSSSRQGTEPLSGSNLSPKVNSNAQIKPTPKGVEQIPQPRALSSTAQPKPKPNSPPPVSVLDWKEKALIRVPGKVRAWNIYQAFSEDEKTNGRKPVDFVTFEKAILSAGIQKVTEANRDFYVDVAVKQALKVVS